MICASPHPPCRAHSCDVFDTSLTTCPCDAQNVFASPRALFRAPDCPLKGTRAETIQAPSAVRTGAVVVHPLHANTTLSKASAVIGTRLNGAAQKGRRRDAMTFMCIPAVYFCSYRELSRSWTTGIDRAWPTRDGTFPSRHRVHLAPLHRRCRNGKPIAAMHTRTPRVKAGLETPRAPAPRDTRKAEPQVIAAYDGGPEIPPPVCTPPCVCVPSTFPAASVTSPLPLTVAPFRLMLAACAVNVPAV